MSAEAPVATPEDLAASNVRLQEQLAAAQAALAAATTPKAPKKPSRVGAFFKRLGKGLWAAVASTDAVKLEKSLAALIVARLLISIGASAGLVSLVGAILHALGVNLP